MSTVWACPGDHLFLYTPFPCTTFLWDSLPNQGRDDPITIALGSPTNEELRYWVTAEEIYFWREGRLPPHLIPRPGGRQPHTCPLSLTLSTDPSYDTSCKQYCLVASPLPPNFMQPNTHAPSRGHMRRHHPLDRELVHNAQPRRSTSQSRHESPTGESP